jgi:hypothetical protein
MDVRITALSAGRKYNRVYDVYLDLSPRDVDEVLAVHGLDGTPEVVSWSIEKVYLYN